MAIYRGPYYPAGGCDGSPRPGTRAAMSWYLGAYADRGAANLGTYACKRIGGGFSVHAERRACDMGTSPYGGVDSPWGWDLANAYRGNSDELGVQLLILGRSIWSCTQPDAGWRDYHGEYHGHLHLELIPDASHNLTEADIEQQIGGGDRDMSLIGLSKGDSGEKVKALQALITYTGTHDLPKYGVDGGYGDETAEGLRQARASVGSEAGAGWGDQVTGYAYAQLMRAVARAEGGSGSSPDLPDEVDVSGGTLEVDW